MTVVAIKKIAKTNFNINMTLLKDIKRVSNLLQLIVDVMSV